MITFDLDTLEVEIEETSLVEEKINETCTECAGSGVIVYLGKEFKVEPCDICNM